MRALNLELVTFHISDDNREEDLDVLFGLDDRNEKLVFDRVPSEEGTLETMYNEDIAERLNKLLKEGYDTRYIVSTMLIYMQLQNYYENCVVKYVDYPDGGPNMMEAGVSIAVALIRTKPNH